MKKGKFGILLCFYPIAAFAAVILNSALSAAALAAAAIFIEKDEWAGRQTLQAWMAAVIVAFFRGLSQAVDRLFYIPVLSSVLSAAAGILSFLVYLAALVLSILCILRVSKDGEANFPLLSSLAYRVYGKMRPRPAPVQYTYQPMQQPGAYPYPAPNGEPVPPQPPQQPYAPPVYAPQNGQAPQYEYTPPMNPAQPVPPVPPAGQPAQPPQSPPQASTPIEPSSFE